MPDLVPLHERFKDDNVDSDQIEYVLTNGTLVSRRDVSYWPSISIY